MRKLLIFLASVILLSGCSTFQPHQVTLQSLHPEINKQTSLPASLNVSVVTRDMRSSSLLGFRISRLSDRAEVHLPLPATDALTEAARIALVKLGATPVQTGSNAEIEIRLQDLSYTANQKALQSVDLHTTITITAKTGGETLSSNYTTDKQYQYATTPSLQDNEKMVNEVILLSISRAFNDPKLINFLSR